MHNNQILIKRHDELMDFGHIISRSAYTQTHTHTYTHTHTHTHTHTKMHRHVHTRTESSHYKVEIQLDQEFNATKDWTRLENRFR
jgi:carbohydrate-binding DOMON domain-containing protein